MKLKHTPAPWTAADFGRGKAHHPMPMTWPAAVKAARAAIAKSEGRPE